MHLSPSFAPLAGTIIGWGHTQIVTEENEIVRICASVLFGGLSQEETLNIEFDTGTSKH